MKEGQAGHSSKSEETSVSDNIFTVIKTISIDIFTSPLNLTLFLLCLYLLYKIIRIRSRDAADDEDVPPKPTLPKLRKDMTLDELKYYDGRNPEGRILVAVSEKIFDVTKNGKTYYGPEGPYGVFAGRDASRALATFSLEASALRDSYDDLSDLGTQQMDSLKEWELQFQEKYEYVGKLLRPGQNPCHYSEDEGDEASFDEDKKSQRSQQEKPKGQ